MAKTKTILLVEDQAIIAQGERKALEERGYTVVTASSGEAAVDLCATRADIDLILMDVKMALRLFEANQNMAQEQYLLHTLMDTVPDHIFFKDLQSRFLKISKSQLDKFGMTDPADLIGKTDFDFFTAEHAQQAFDDEQTIIATDRMMIKEEKETWPDKPDSWVYSIKLPLKDKAGRTIGTFGISRDMTDLKRAEATLAREQSLLQALMETSSDHIYFKDLQGRFIRNSRSQAEFLGMADPAMMIGKTDFDFFPMEHAKRAFEDEQEVIRTGQAIRKEEAISDTEPIVWMSIEKMPLRDKDGKITGTFGISRDISEHRRTERRIQGLLTEKELILKEVHHRIKNNMAIVKSLLSLQASAITEPNAVKALDDAVLRIESMMVLYENLYRSSEFATYSVGDYLISLVDRIMGSFPQSGAIRVEKKFGKFDLEVRQLQNVGIIVNELITNILKYAFIGRSEGVIALTGSMVGDRVAITVEDDGVGIPESVAFENSKGFGLMLVKALTDQMGGEIRMERGRGTRFVLQFDAEKQE